MPLQPYIQLQGALAVLIEMQTHTESQEHHDALQLSIDRIKVLIQGEQIKNDH